MFPNPANNVVNLQLDLKKPQQVDVAILSIDGKKQTANYTGSLLAGSQTISLNTTALASGIYMVSIQTPEGRLVKKLNIIKD
ncbi:MAG: T9SS type A sorting domain-containing protein [Sphingobacteriales bacterium JAD_PAG50586_3]|nr:MAG: T9SS type A sorting domain-containing protein [Sphingobacteriales bacterium JAD_PAG50586_3]